MQHAASEMHDSKYTYLELDRHGDVVFYGRLRRYNGQRNWIICEHNAHPVHDAGSDNVRLYRRPDEARAEFSRAVSRARAAAASQVRYDEIDLVPPVETQG